SSKNTWYVANNGPVPGAGGLASEAFRPATINQPNTNPSVTLSFLVYDWLKSLGLRPSLSSAIEALNFGKGSPVSDFKKLEQQLLHGGTQNDVDFVPVTSYIPPQQNLANN